MGFEIETDDLLEDIIAREDFKRIVAEYTNYNRSDKNTPPPPPSPEDT